MKKLLFSILFSILSTTFIIAKSPNDFSLNKSSLLYPQNIVVDDDWILIGEMDLFYYADRWCTIKANLYVREIAQKLIYRVAYNNKFYTVNSNPDYNPSRDYIVYKYKHCCNIEGKRCYFNAD